MITINTKFGKIFIEEVENFFDGDSDGKVRLYDSEERYLNYIEKETIIDAAEAENVSPADILSRYVKEIEACETIEDFLGKVIEGEYELYSKCWKDVASFMRNICIDDYETPESLLTNEWVNKIGDYYIVVSEN